MLNKLRTAFAVLALAAMLMPAAVLAGTCGAVPVGGTCTPDACGGTVSEGDTCGTSEAPGRCRSSGFDFQCEEATTMPGDATDKAADEADKSAVPKDATVIKPRTLPNPLASGSDNPDLFTVLGRATTIFTSISGSIALLMFVYGGIMWISSAGRSDRVEAGRKALMYSVIGLVIIFGSYAILRTIFIALGAQL